MIVATQREHLGITLVPADAGAPKPSVRIVAGREVSGRLLDAPGRPVAGELTPTAWSGHRLPDEISALLRVQASSDGVFRALLPVGTWHLQVGAPGRVGQSLEISVSDADHAALGDISLPTLQSIVGRVVAEDDAPVSGATIQAIPQNTLVGGPHGRTSSRVDGSFALNGLGSGPYALTVSAPGFEGRTVVATAEADIAVVLRRGGVLTGTVLDSNGEPVEHFSVVASRTDVPDQIATARSGESRDGSFSLGGAAEGTFDVRIAAPQHETAEVRDVVVRQNEITDLGAVYLALGPMVNGLVVDASGRPVSGARAALVGVTHRGDSNASAANEAMTDQDGEFTLRSPESGHVRLIVSHADFVPSETGVTVEADADTRKSVTLHRGGTIEGTVRRPDGTPLAGMQVTTNVGGPSGNSRGATTDFNGRFRIPRIAAGTAVVRLMGSDGVGGLTSTAWRAVRVAEGHTARADFTVDSILVSGTTLRGNRPIPGIDLRFWKLEGTTVSFDMGAMTQPSSGAWGPARMHAVSDDHGHFELLVDEPGDYLVQIQPVDGLSSYGGQMLRVPTEGLRDTVVRIGGARLRGRVVGQSHRGPLAGARVAATSLDGPAWPARTTSDERGHFEMDVSPGKYLVAVSQDGYLAVSLRLDIESDRQVHVEMPGPSPGSPSR